MHCSIAKHAEIFTDRISHTTLAVFPKKYIHIQYTYVHPIYIPELITHIKRAHIPKQSATIRTTKGTYFLHHRTRSMALASSGGSTYMYIGRLFGFFLFGHNKNIFQMLSFKVNKLGRTHLLVYLISLNYFF